MSWSRLFGLKEPRSHRVTVVLDAGQGAQDVTEKTQVYGVVMPNDGSTKGHKWTEFRVPVDEVEKKTGYDFLSAVEDGVEARGPIEIAVSSSVYQRSLKNRTWGSIATR
jgi:DNA/RNA endonuclease G (NUC1)